MKILLFGAAGQLGREWQTYLSKEKHKDLYLIPYTSSKLDITQFNRVKYEVAERQPDVIINCAAYTKVDKAEEEHERALKVNGEAVGALAKVSAKHGVKLIHFSTDYVFAGNKNDRERFPAGYPEDCVIDSVNWYGQTKWRGEQAIRNSGCEHLIIRISWLCGAFGHNFVKTMLRLAESKKQVKVVDDQVGSPTFADKLVEDTFKLIQQKKEGTYHQTSKGIISWADFAKAICKISGNDMDIDRIPSSEYPTKAARPFFSKLDTAKIEQIKGIKMQGWETGLERLLNKLDEAAKRIK